MTPGPTAGPDERCRRHSGKPAASRTERKTAVELRRRIPPFKKALPRQSL